MKRRNFSEITGQDLEDDGDKKAGSSEARSSSRGNRACVQNNSAINHKKTGRFCLNTDSYSCSMRDYDGVLTISALL